MRLNLRAHSPPWIQAIQLTRSELQITCTRLSLMHIWLYLILLNRIARKTPAFDGRYLPRPAASNIPTIENSPSMCEVRIITYQSCAVRPRHQRREGFNRCSLANARPNQSVCVPASGQLRDLPLSQDAQDRNIAGKCPICHRRTPSDSSG